MCSYLDRRDPRGSLHNSLLLLLTLLLHLRGVGRRICYWTQEPLLLGEVIFYYERSAETLSSSVFFLFIYLFCLLVCSHLSCE
jgi:hypothetical protein